MSLRYELLLTLIVTHQMVRSLETQALHMNERAKNSLIVAE